MSNSIKHIACFFWPLLQKMDNAVERREVKTAMIAANNDSHLKDVLESVAKIYQNEFERMHSIEGKASIFISSATFLATLIVGISTLLAKEINVGLFIVILIFLAFIISLYMARVLYFSIRALERSTLYYINPNDYYNLDSQTTYLKSIICDYINATNKNYYPINTKVNFVVMAQKYYKRFLWSLCIYTLFLALYCLSKFELNANNSFIEILQSINNYHPEPWLLLCLFGLSTISCIVVIITCYGCKK